MFDNYPEILTVHDIQNMLRISRHAAYDIVHSGAIPSRKIGRVYRIKKADLLAFLATDASQR